MTSVSSPTTAGANPFSLTNIKGEKIIIGAFLVAILAYAIEHSLLGSGQTVAVLATFALVAVIIGVAIRVAHHAEVLAEKVGEPYGTMILTSAAVLVEVVILAIMMMNNPSPTLAASTILAALHCDMNLIIGMAALLGGIKHGEMAYNDNSGRSYVVMIMVAVGISMVIPKFIPLENWKSFSIFTIISMLALYGLFLRMQTKEHSYFFSYNYEKNKKRLEKVEKHEELDEESTSFSAFVLFAGIIVTGLLAEVMSKSMSVSLEGTNIPPIFAGMVVALISASPEILAAMKAAMANRYQATVNIGLGASLSTVILTVAIIEAIALFTGRDIDMALSPVQMTLLGITMVVSALNVSDGETNAIEGGVHIFLFATFLYLSCIGL